MSFTLQETEIVSSKIFEWGLFFKESYLDLLLLLNLPRIMQRLFGLIGLGTYGEFAQSWIEALKGLGCLHLLVLSGSQANGFASILKWQRGFWILLGLNHIWAVRISSILSGCFLLLYGAAIAWPPPLSRGIIMALLQLLPWRWVKWGSFVSAFLVHAILFPVHLSTLSFYLSWISSLFIVISGELKLGSWTRRVFQSIACSLLIFFALGMPSDPVRLLLLALFSNLILGVVFERFLQPFVSLLLGFAVFGTLLKILGMREVWKGTCAMVSVFFRPFFAGLGDTLLVALRGIRYIQ